MIHIWEDKWIPSLPHTHPPLSTSNFSGTLVKDLISQGSWNIPLLTYIFDTNTFQAITLIHINRYGTDKPKWNLSANGIFLYQILVQCDSATSPNQNSPWGEIWNIQTTHRIPIFAYKCINDMVPTTTKLAPYTDMPNYGIFCDQQNKTLERLFFVCPFHM